MHGAGGRHCVNGKHIQGRIEMEGSAGELLLPGVRAQRLHASHLPSSVQSVLKTVNPGLPLLSHSRRCSIP